METTASSVKSGAPLGLILAFVLIGALLGVPRIPEVLASDVENKLSAVDSDTKEDIGAVHCEGTTAVAYRCRVEFSPQLHLPSQMVMLDTPAFPAPFSWSWSNLSSSYRVKTNFSGTALSLNRAKEALENDLWTVRRLARQQVPSDQYEAARNRASYK